MKEIFSLLRYICLFRCSHCCLCVCCRVVRERMIKEHFLLLKKNLDHEKFRWKIVFLGFIAGVEK